MKLKDYITGLQEFMVKNPETMDLEAVTSKDDEGNEFNPIHFGPSKGELIDRDFTVSDDKVNAVCVN